MKEGAMRFNDDPLADSIAQGIDQKALGIFIAGSRDNNPKHTLLVMPRSWIVEGSSVPCL